MKFLGYDPGGRGTHGVASIKVNSSGEIIETPVSDVVEDAGSAWDWLSENADASALGIDTLLAWSLKGSRVCDNALRRRYRKYAPSVIPQNALYSSMTLNGALIAKRASKHGWPVFESHPKLLVRVLPSGDAGPASALRWYSAIKSNHDGTSKGIKRADDMADAVVAAWCAAQGHLKHWKVDLFELSGDHLERIQEVVSYPWFENI